MNINTLLFDLGGVLIELGSLEPLLATSELTPEEVQQNWLHSPSVRRFESGQCSNEAFAESMIAELSLNIDVEQFLNHFNAWPVGVYSGAERLLTELSKRFHVACFSNTNTAHYDGFFSTETILSQFDSRFLSFEMGLLKPDMAAFEYVSGELGVAADEILFFDDNARNIEAATQSGMQAALANTPDGVINQLKAHGVHV